VRRLLSTNKFRELCIKHGPRALEIIRAPVSEPPCAADRVSATLDKQR
jgi:hypothetical protein